MLLGADITIYTDHRNLTFRTLSVQRVLCWQLFLEEFNPKNIYIPGKDNVLAGCFLWFPRMDKQLEGKRAPNCSTLIAFEDLCIPPQSDELYSYTVQYSPAHASSTFSSLHCKCTYSNSAEVADDKELYESFLNHPLLASMQNLITILNIQQYQFQDLSLNQLQQQQPECFLVRTIDNRPVICYRRQPDDPENLWKIALPSTLTRTVVEWYHQEYTAVSRVWRAITNACKLATLDRSSSRLYWPMETKDRTGGSRVQCTHLH
eukprot:15325942-Ditylum_brightwellii.AAC.1